MPKPIDPANRPPGYHQTVRSKGINQLTDLEGFTMDQLLTSPRVCKQSAALLLEALSKEDG